MYAEDERARSTRTREESGSGGERERARERKIESSCAKDRDDATGTSKGVENASESEKNAKMHAARGSVGGGGEFDEERERASRREGGYAPRWKREAPKERSAGERRTRRYTNGGERRSGTRGREGGGARRRERDGDARMKKREGARERETGERDTARERE